MKTENNIGEIICWHCKKEILGEAIIGYKYDEDFVDEVIIVHKDCVKRYNLQKVGKIHQCPKCNGAGGHLKDTLNIYHVENKPPELVLSSEVQQNPARYHLENMEKVRDIKESCHLCDGDGYLAKEPIPVITDWRKAT